jgi:hypothetical protein
MVPRVLWRKEPGMETRIGSQLGTDVRDHLAEERTIPCRPTIRSRAAISSVNLALSLNPKKLDCSFGVHSPAACSPASLAVRTRSRKAHADPSSIFPRRQGTYLENPRRHGSNR